MFVAALFRIDKTWKQTRCPIFSEWVNKQVHPGNGILFHTKKK